MAEKKPSSDAVNLTGRRLGGALKTLKRRQVELVERSGVDAPALSKFLTGKVGLEAERLLAVLRAASEMGVSLEHVICGSGPASKTLLFAETAHLQREIVAVVREAALAAQGEGDAKCESPAARHRRG